MDRRPSFSFPVASPSGRSTWEKARNSPIDQAPPWGDDTVSFPRYVQPVLDKHCGSCHQGEGEAWKVLDLASRPAFDTFTEPYLTLIGRPTWGQPYRRPPDAGVG